MKIMTADGNMHDHAEVGSASFSMAWFYTDNMMKGSRFVRKHLLIQIMKQSPFSGRKEGIF